MYRQTAKRILSSVLPALMLTVCAPATMAGKTLKQALEDGKVDLDLRYRYEAVDQDPAGPADPVVNDAKASTLRLRLGYQTGDYRGLFGYAGFEALRVVGAERYNSTANGLGSYPVVADPTDEEVDQAYLGYRAAGDTVLKLGRQRIVLENHRFVGNVGFRQNEQTFDALSVESAPGPGVEVFYAHLNNANRVFGEHHPIPARADTNLFADVLQVAYKTSAGRLTGYAHFLEFEDAPAASHRNVGLRFAGSHSLSDKIDLLYSAEVTDQSDYKDAPATVDAGYRLAELGIKAPQVTAKLGYERLEGDGVYAFQTPLATLHAFNGWADMFLTTPPAGLVDTYLILSSTFSGVGVSVVYHDFDADFGSTAYGSETGFAVGKTFRKTTTVHLKYASYDADTFAVDTDKLWFTLQFKL